jgi:hypothetical protein
METTIIFGAGSMGKTLYPYIENRYGAGIIYFADSNPFLWEKTLFDKQIISPDKILNMSYDRIIITTISGLETISDRLTKIFKVPSCKIDTSYIREPYERTLCARNRFLTRFAEIVYTKELEGSVAEGGVFEGYFAKRINAAFPNKTLYLFDTFEGFDERDVSIELGDTRNRANHFNSNITEDDLLAVMPHPECIKIRKGYFPETVADIDDKFVFVNLDFDMYNPTLAGLEFFYPRMVRGGIILVHDYFVDSIIPNKELVFQGARLAVEKFCKEHDVMYMPIADEMSVAILKG